MRESTLCDIDNIFIDGIMRDVHLCQLVSLPAG
jgi:hypothetical protein